MVISSRKLLPGLLIFIFVINCSLIAEEIQVKGRREKLNHEIRIKKLKTNIKIDGILNEEIWNTITPVSDFIQREPLEGILSSEKTEVRVFYDENNIYFAITCLDNQPERIVANVLKRDVLLENNDYFEIIIDTYHDHRNGFYFATNPLGAKRDALLRDEGNNFNLNWNGIWECRSNIGDYGWSAEILIPFKTLRFRDGNDSIWGINFGRMIARKREESYWTPVLRSYGIWGKYKVSKFGHMVGLSGIIYKGKVELRPYILSGGIKDFENENNDLQKELNFGLDVKYKLSSHFIADLTYKTDFAQVEADLEQVNLSRFDLYYPEKRDFFLEGANIFRFGERFDPGAPGRNTLFFSRKIGITNDGNQIPLLGGVRMTGKVSDYNVGFLNLMTEEKSYYDSADKKVTIPKTNYTVLRIKKEVLAKSNIGFITLNKQERSTGEYNRGIGLDANFSLYTNLQFGGFLAKTFTPGLKNKDYAGYLEFDYLSDFYNASFSYLDIGENFDAQMGFVKRSDIRSYKFSTGIGPRPGILNIRQIFIGPELGNYITDHNNKLLTRSWTPFLVIVFQDGTSILLTYQAHYEYLWEDFEIRNNTVIPESVYKFNNFFTQFNTDQSKNFYISGSMLSGEFFNGKILSFDIAPTVKPLFNFEVNLRYSKNILELPIENGNFTTNILGTRLTYSFSPDLYAKLFIQYNDSEKSGTINFLLNYIYKPGMNFFLVYNEFYDNGGTKSDLKNRVLKAKINYVLNL